MGINNNDDNKFDKDTEEIEEMLQDMKRSEREGLQNILKYFDRIHDKLFTFNNILIAAYFTLSQLFEMFSIYRIIIPIANLCLLLIIEYRMMEMSRFDSRVTRKTSEDIAQNGKAINRTTRYSLYTIISTSIVVIIFLVNLFSLDLKAKSSKTFQTEQTDNRNIENTERDSISLLGAWTDNSSENASIAFYEDSMIFVDALKYAKYNLKSDSLFWHLDNGVLKSRILHLSQDSLIIENEFGTQKYSRVNE